MHSAVPHPSLTPRDLLSAWARVLSGSVPLLSIEITRECPLSCPGCYAYGETHLGSGVTAYNKAGQVVPAGSASIVAYVANNPNARYIQAALGARSNGGRNTLPLDHINNFDFGLLKRLNFTEKYRFEIGAQAFNLFNHPQFIGGYLSDVNLYTTNLISRSFLVPNNKFFDQYQGFFPSNSRVVQIVARFVF